MKSVLFVCLGNICRSPMAEIVFRSVIKQRNIEKDWIVDSAGTSGWHVGDDPDPRTIQVCTNMLGKHMIPVTHKCRQVKASDFNEFQYIFCMDESNLYDLKKMAPHNCTTNIVLLASYDSTGTSKIIADPYYGGIFGFENNFNQILRSIDNFLDSLGK